MQYPEELLGLWRHSIRLTACGDEFTALLAAPCSTASTQTGLNDRCHQEPFSSPAAAALSVPKRSNILTVKATSSLALTTICAANFSAPPATPSGISTASTLRLKLSRITPWIF